MHRRHLLEATPPPSPDTVRNDAACTWVKVVCDYLFCPLGAGHHIDQLAAVGSIQWLLGARHKHLGHHLVTTLQVGRRLLEGLPSPGNQRHSKAHRCDKQLRAWGWQSERMTADGVGATAIEVELRSNTRHTLTSNATSSLLLGMITYRNAETAMNATAKDFQCRCTLSGNAVNTPLPPLITQGEGTQNVTGLFRRNNTKNQTS